MSDHDDTGDDLEEDFESDEDDDEDDEQEAAEPDPNDRRVWIEFRQKGSKGPPAKSGRRGRVCLEGPVTMAFVSHLLQLNKGPEAGLCEPLSVWISDDGQKWEQVLTTSLAPGQAKEQLDRAQLEYEREMQALQSKLTGTKNAQEQANARLEFTEQRISLAESTLRRMEQEVEQMRETLVLERKRADDEREQLKADRQLRLQERALMLQQDAEDRQVRQQAVSKTIAELDGVVAASAQQVKQHITTNTEVMGALKANFTDEMEASASLVKQEKVLHALIQASKMNTMQAATELRENLDKVPQPKEPQETWVGFAREMVGNALPIIQQFIPKPAGS